MSDDENLPYWANNPTSVSLLKAYQRILTGTTKVIDKNKKINLSNVSIEAGFHRSMLSRSRFPELCKLIDEGEKFNKKRSKSVKERLNIALEANRNLRIKNEELKKQLAIYRDQLLSTEKLIIKLRNKNSKGDNVYEI